MVSGHIAAREIRSVRLHVDRFVATKSINQYGKSGYRTPLHTTAHLPDELLRREHVEELQSLLRLGVLTLQINTVY